MRCKNLLAKHGLRACVCATSKWFQKSHLQYIKIPPVCHSHLSVAKQSTEVNCCHSEAVWNPKKWSNVTHTCHQGTQNQITQTTQIYYTETLTIQNDKFHSPIPVFIFICVREELRASQREVQSGQGQISVAKTHQLDWRGQALVLILHWLGDDLQVWQTCLLHFPSYTSTPVTDRHRHMHKEETEWIHYFKIATTFLRCLQKYYMTPVRWS